MIGSETLQMKYLKTLNSGFICFDPSACYRCRLTTLLLQILAESSVLTHPKKVEMVMIPSVSSAIMRPPPVNVIPPLHPNPSPPIIQEEDITQEVWSCKTVEKKYFFKRNKRFTQRTLRQSDWSFELSLFNFEDISFFKVKWRWLKEHFGCPIVLWIH